MLFDLTIWQAAALLSKWFAYLGSLFAIGSLMFVVIVQQHPTTSKRLPLAAVAAVVALLATTAQFFIQSGRLLDDGMVGVMDREMWELVAQTPLGTSAGTRIAGLLLLLMAALSTSRVRIALALPGIALTAASFALVGHATGEPGWFLSALVTLHVLVAAFWLGGLRPLYLAAGGDDREAAGRLAHRFGQQAAWAVGLLLIAGGWLAYELVGSFAALFGTNYGLALLLKLALVAVLLVLATANKLRFVPRLRAGDMASAHHLRASIAWEASIILTIFAATAVLTTILALPQPTGAS